MSKAQSRKQRKLDAVPRGSHKLDAQLYELEETGFHMVYIDGSSKQVTNVGYVGGYGIYSEGLHAVGAHLPMHLHQTNNTAEITSKRGC